MTQHDDDTLDTLIIDNTRPHVFRALIRYTDAEGREQSYGGLDAPTVGGTTPRAAALAALGHAPAFVRAHYSTVETIAQYTDRYSSAPIEYSDSILFTRGALDPLLAGVKIPNATARRTPSL